MNKIKLLFVLLLLAITNSNAQFVTLDYSSFTSSSCDVFENFTTFQGILHQTKRGDITKNSSQGGLELKYDYFTGGTNQKGSEFSISGITFKKDFKYIVKITAKNNGNYSEPAGLKCNFNPNNIDLGCNGVNTVNPNNNTFGIISSDWFQTVNGTAFVEYTFTSDYLITSLSSLGVGTFSRFNISSSANFLQSIFIKKIVITEIPPPPSFTFSPTNLSLACGDTAAKTLTVTPANVPTGAVVSYSWFPTPGWTQVGSTINSRTFQPISGPSVPSNVSVIPFINGFAQPTLNCTVTRTLFTSTAAINGASAICTIGASDVYTINAGSGNTVDWSGSNLSIATLSNATNSQVTITRQAPGEFILNATITNLCNEVVNIPPRAISGGVPQFNSFTFGNEFLIPACFSSSCLTTGLQSSVINASFSGMSAFEISDDSNWEWVSNNSLIFLNSLADRTQVCPIAMGSSSFKVRAKNACGWSDWVDYQLFDITECPFNFRTSATIYTIYPNPSKDIVNIELKDSKIKPEKEAIVSGTLFDLMGQSRGKVQIKNNSASLSVAGLKKGIYVLNINIDGKVEGHQVIVE